MLLPYDAMRTALSQLGFGHVTMPLRDTTCRSDALIVATTHALLDAGRSSAAEAYVHSAAAFLAVHVLARYAATSVAVDELTPRMLSVFRDAMGRNTSLRELAALAGVGETRLAQFVLSRLKHRHPPADGSGRCRLPDQRRPSRRRSTTRCCHGRVPTARGRTIRRSGPAPHQCAQLPPHCVPFRHPVIHVDNPRGSEWRE
ncbi:hypothetical protein [Streptomyces sp. NPDC004135]